jgi:hypothetical protein
LRKSASSNSSSGIGQTELSSHECVVVECLLSWRNRMSIQSGKPITSILSNKVLLAIAKQRPTTIWTLLNIKGIRKPTLAEYGDSLLNCLTSEACTVQTTPPTPPTTSTRQFNDVLQDHVKNHTRSLGWTDELAEQLHTYNTTHSFETHIQPRCVRQSHLQACTCCKRLDVFAIGKMFFSGQHNEQTPRVKYCLECVTNVLRQAPSVPKCQPTPSVPKCQPTHRPAFYRTQQTN